MLGIIVLEINWISFATVSHLPNGITDYVQLIGKAKLNWPTNDKIIMNGGMVQRNPPKPPSTTLLK